MNRMPAKKADLGGIYQPYLECGRGPVNLGTENNATMVWLSKYMIVKDDPQITALFKHQTYKALYSVSKEAKKYLLDA